MTNEIIIKLSIHSEGGISYDIYQDPEGVELPDDSEDGGICTSGMHLKNCDGQSDNGGDCEGCPKAMAKPYTPKDWKNALDMATAQTLDLIKRNA